MLKSNDKNLLSRGVFVGEIINVKRNAYAKPPCFSLIQTVNLVQALKNLVKSKAKNLNGLGIPNHLGGFAVTQSYRGVSWCENPGGRKVTNVVRRNADIGWRL